MASYSAAQKAKDWKFIYATAEGRRAIADLLASNGVFKPMMAADPSNPYITAFNEGRRNVALDVIKYLKVTPRDLDDVASAMTEVDDG